MLLPEFAAEYAYLLYPIRSAEAFNKGRISDPAALGLSAPDPRTVRIELERQTPYLPVLAALPPWSPVTARRPCFAPLPPWCRVNPRVLARFGAAAKRATAWPRIFREPWG